MIMRNRQRNIESIFWSKVNKRKDHECWLWRKAKSDGYGLFWDGTKLVGAHRFSWELTRKCKVPEGKMILHMCDNRMCVNPNHLYCGDASQNAKDRAERNPRSHGTFEEKIKKMYKLPDDFFN